MRNNINRIISRPTNNVGFSSKIVADEPDPSIDNRRNIHSFSRRYRTEVGYTQISVWFGVMLLSSSFHPAYRLRLHCPMSRLCPEPNSVPFVIK